MEERDWYTTAEVAERIGRTQKTALRAGKAGVVPGMYLFMGRYQWVKTEVDAYLALALKGRERAAKGTGQKGHKGQKRNKRT